MRYLASALYAEGPTDYRFLIPLLERVLEDVCSRLEPGGVEVGAVFGLDAPEARGQERAAQVVAAVRASADAFHVVFVHTDGASDVAVAFAERVEPAARRLREELPAFELRVVGVVPVREMEAWCLADGDALRSVFRTNREDDVLGLPAKTHEIERLLDPKRALEAAFRAGGGRSDGPAAALLGDLGLVVDLERLRLLPAFQRFEADLLLALRELRFVP